jgi:hypothetical protein
MCRLAGVALALLVLGCSSPSQRQSLEATEITALTPLKQTYPGIVMGFEIERDKTLVVSLDLQTYIGMDDDAATALKHNVFAKWRTVWRAEHSGAHGKLHVRFIDFIGRKVAEQAATV